VIKEAVLKRSFGGIADNVNDLLGQVGIPLSEPAL
jgi:hypothetical protein